MLMSPPLQGLSNCVVCNCILNLKGGLRVVDFQPGDTVKLKKLNGAALYTEAKKVLTRNDHTQRWTQHGLLSCKTPKKRKLGPASTKYPSSVIDVWSGC